MRTARPQTVVVLGASDKPERYANKAIKELLAHGHRVIPVSPRLNEVAGLSVKSSLSEIEQAVDTLSVYLGPAASSGLAGQIVALKPGRVIFNPGSENGPLIEELEAAGVAVELACTLVLLRTDQF